MISAVIHLFLFEVQHIAGTSHNTQAASLASFRIHYYGSMNFCHKRNSLMFKRLLIVSSFFYPQKYSFLGTWQAKKNEYLPTSGDFFFRCWQKKKQFSLSVSKRNRSLSDKDIDKVLNISGVVLFCKLYWLWLVYWGWVARIMSMSKVISEMLTEPSPLRS